MAPSSTKGALILSWRRPATKSLAPAEAGVVVVRCPQGTLPTTRCPQGRALSSQASHLGGGAGLVHEDELRRERQAPGATLPVSSKAVQWIAEGTLTSKRAAACRRDSPAETPSLAPGSGAEGISS